ncbi:MAG: hypothetical protein QXL94_00055 [Candidatus Parvarchaeum sp.]
MVTLTELLLKYGFPAVYLWVVPLALIIAGLIFVFFSKRAWQITLIGSGAALGYMVSAKYIVPFAMAHGIGVVWWIYVILIFLAILLVWKLVKLIVILGIGALVGYIMLHQTYVHLYSLSLVGYSLPVGAIAIGLVAVVIAYALYSKLIILIGASLGALAIYVGFLSYLAQNYAILIALVFFMIGIGRHFIAKKSKKPKEVGV